MVLILIVTKLQLKKGKNPQMSKPKNLLVKIGALDILTKMIWEISTPILLFFWSRVSRVCFTPTQILKIILAVILGTLVETAVVFLIVKGYPVGMILKSIHNFLFCIYCLMNFRLIFLSAVSEMFQSRIIIHICLFIISGLHFAFSAYFQYTVMFNKPVRAYVAEVKNRRTEKLKNSKQYFKK